MKKIKIATIILLILLVSIVSFGGVYVQVQNRMENQIKDYSYEMGLSKYRQIVLEPKEEETSESTEDTENIEEDSTTNEDISAKKVDNTDNLVKSKEIIEKRLKAIGVTNYIIRQNSKNIEVEIPEDDADYVVTNIATQGIFQIVDADTDEVLANNDSIKEAKILAQSTENGTVIYLSIEFKDKALLESITKKYRTLSEEELAALSTTPENTAEAENSQTEVAENTESKTATQPKAKLQLDGNEMTSQSFDEAITTGAIVLSLNSATTNRDKIQSEIKRGNNIASILDNGNIPVELNVIYNSTIKTDITSKMLTSFEGIVKLVFLILFIVLIVKYKKSAVYACISFIGFVAIYLLVIRYTNVNLSIEGLGGIVFVLILNYIIIRKVLENGGIIESYKDFILELIPILIAVIVFCFTKWANIASFGMILFWGIIVTLAYHLTITKTLLKTSSEK